VIICAVCDRSFSTFDPTVRTTPEHPCSGSGQLADPQIVSATFGQDQNLLAKLQQLHTAMIAEQTKQANAYSALANYRQQAANIEAVLKG
jgi:hypothetical protein